MNTEQQLSNVADGYRAQGYQVVVRPGPEVLPPFAKDFNVEILATRGDGSVLASAKMSRAELEADVNLPRYAEITGNQPGWRFDLFILGGESPLTKVKRDVTEPSEDDIRQGLDDVEGMLQAGFVASAVSAAWAMLEAAMRRKLRAQGQDAGWEESPRTMLNELYSDGVFTNSTFRNLEELFQLRNEVVHGFVAHGINPSAVRFLVETARRLLTESQPVKQLA